jgi:hypothetical protein
MAAIVRNEGEGHQGGPSYQELGRWNTWSDDLKVVDQAVQSILNNYMTRWQIA